MYRVLLTKTAEKQLKQLPPREQRRIAALMVSLEVEPRPVGCKKLTGTQNSYRIRSGDYRIIYDIFEREITNRVLKIGHRRDVYREK